MDGQRRIARPVKPTKRTSGDVSSKLRFAARAGAVLFLASCLVRGVVAGGHLNYPGSPWLKLPGQIAGLLGLAANDIEMAGLQHHAPQEVLTAINVKPGGPIIGFDAKKARNLLQELDWVESATVERRFPNQLIISIAEREPFVVWQHDGVVEVVDQAGKPMRGIVPNASNMLLHVVGAGANIAASELINQMEATPGLMHDIKAAVRVGDRRWDIHMHNGLVISLPEKNVDARLKSIETAYLSKGTGQMPIKLMDFRVEGETAYTAKTNGIETDPTTTSSIQ